VTRRRTCCAALTFFALLALATPPVSAQRVWEVSAPSWTGVWRSSSLVKEGRDLEDVGQYDLAAQRMACLVDTGTRLTANFTGGVQIHDGDYLGGVARIVVIDGPAKGGRSGCSARRGATNSDVGLPEDRPSRSSPDEAKPRSQRGARAVLGPLRARI
jgi:hypothetical protein